LTMYFAATLTPFERYLVEGIVFVALGRNTPCRLVEFREVDSGIVLRFSGAPLADLQRVGDALWVAFWRQSSSTQSVLSTALPEDIVPLLESIRQKVDAIELRQLSPEALEMLDDSGSKHILKKDLKIVQTWGQRTLPALGKAAMAKVLGAGVDTVFDRVQDGLCESLDHQK
jgi:hypothetical protein